MILEQGRPADCTGRLPKEIRVYDFLDQLGISYQRIDHEAAATMEICAQIDATLEANGYTTIGTKWYWSSTESDSYDAYLLGFNSGSRNSSGKFPANNVCAILAF